MEQEVTSQMGVELLENKGKLRKPMNWFDNRACSIKIQDVFHADFMVKLYTSLVQENSRNVL